jgi:hypothetical protein
MFDVGGFGRLWWCWMAMMEFTFGIGKYIVQLIDLSFFKKGKISCHWAPPRTHNYSQLTSHFPSILLPILHQHL